MWIIYLLPVYASDVIWSPIALEHEELLKLPLNKVRATGLSDETMEPASVDAPDTFMSLALYVWPLLSVTEKVTSWAFPVMLVLGVIKTVVLSSVATISMDENEAGVVDALFQKVWKGV